MHHAAFTHEIDRIGNPSPHGLNRAREFDVSRPHTGLNPPLPEARRTRRLPRGRISVTEVKEEIGRLQSSWRETSIPEPRESQCRAVLGEEALAALDPFDRVQLGYVIEICRQSRSLSEAGRTLFAVTRQKRAQANDADRLRKYLARHGLDWHRVVAS